MAGAKRVLDGAIALGGLLLLAPLLAVLAIAIRLESPGPAIFRQQRVGRHGRVFRIYKLRSMSASGEAGSQVTKLGRRLRRYKLDELPQLVNVLKGEMSLVGPRPELPEFVNLYPPDVRARILSVRPGITDPASLAYFDEDARLATASDPERLYVEQILPAKLQLSLQYLQQRSLLSDARILAHTMARIFEARGRCDRLTGTWVAR